MSIEKIPVAVPNLPHPSLPHPDGIYFGLPEDEYHADQALGSTSLKMLAKGAADYWWGSSMSGRFLADDEAPKRGSIFCSARRSTSSSWKATPLFWTRTR